MSSSNATTDTAAPPPPPPLPHSLVELDQMLHEANIRHALLNKKLMNHQCDLEGFMRRQDVRTKKIEDSNAVLVESAHSRGAGQPTHGPPPPPGTEPDSLARVKPEPPRFNGDNAPDWIQKVQKYFNHYYTPLHDRIYLTSYLFDHPASSWFTYWEQNCKTKSWDEFLVAVKNRFDPDLYVDHLGKLATVRQT